MIEQMIDFFIQKKTKQNRCIHNISSVSLYSHAQLLDPLKDKQTEGERRRIIHSKGCSSGSICNVLIFAPLTLSVLPLNIEYLDVLIEWGCTWIWDSFRLVGKERRIEEVIVDNSCMAVMNRLYIRKVNHGIYLATFMLECSNGRCKLVG